MKEWTNLSALSQFFQLAESTPHFGKQVGHKITCMKIMLLLLLATVCVNCSTNPTIEYNELEIKIKIENSFEYDLKNEQYTVFFLSNPPYTVKFQLSDKEKAEIAQYYSDLRLNEIQGNMLIEDKCKDMPKMYVAVYINSKRNSFEIKFDGDCGKFESKHRSVGKRIKRFSDLVLKILKAKPEIKASSPSDIFYI